MAAPRQDFPVEVIAQLLGVTPRRVQQLASQGWIPRGAERGTYPLVGSVQGYIRYLHFQIADAKAKKRQTPSS